MSQITQKRFSEISTLLFRALCLYLMLYFLFISDYADNYRILWHLNQPLKYISNGLGLFLNKLFFDPNFKEIRFFDSYWTYSKLLSFLVFALMAASVWTMIDKARGSRKLFVYMYTFTRYYLFVTLILYGLWKIFETQFVMGPHEFLRPMNYYTPQIMYWTSVALSKSYQIFGGVIEIVSAFFLLSRKTTTLGALITLGVLINILILDIGYDVPIKITVIHLLFFNLLLLWPDIQKLFRFFVLRGTETLSNIPPLIENKKYQKLGFVIKVLFIGFAVIPQIKNNITTKYELNNPSYKDLIGIHEIDTSNRILADLPTKINNPLMWKTFAIGKGGGFFVLFHEDSLSRYQLDADTVRKILRITSWDSSFNGQLHYRNIDSTSWLFEGNLGRDSYRFITKQSDIYKHLLFKDYGRIVWSWNSSSPPNYSLH